MVQARPYHFETMKTARLLVGCAVFFVVVAAVLIPVLVHQGVYGVLASCGLAALAIGSMAVAADRFDDAGIYFELRMRRTFRKVCAERGLTTVSATDKRRMVYPAYGQLMGSQDAFRLVIAPLVGQTVGEWEKAGPAFSLAFESKPVRFDDAGNGRVVMKVGTQLMGSHPMETVLNQVADDAHETWREQLRTAIIGKTEHGDAYGLPLIDTHTLIAGITGAGKGSYIWSAILRLVPFARAGVVRFWGFDPKRMELSIGRKFFGDRYAAKPEEMVELLERAHNEMQDRAASLSGKSRRFEPSRETPMELIVIDELGYLSALLQDRKMAARVEKALSGILVLGRAVGFVVIGALQDPRKSTLDFRDLFPTRVAMRLPKGMVDLVLGTGMYEAGAQCDLIPAGGAGAGVAFVLAENSTVPKCIRASWCSDEFIMEVANSFEEPTPQLAS
ncbi:MAG: FtsK/SpoIIIE domain-containing protein [Hyphomicrobium sp.]